MDEEFLSERAKHILNGAAEMYIKHVCGQLTDNEIATGLCKFIGAFINSSKIPQEDKQSLVEAMCKDILTEVMERGSDRT